MSKLETRFKQDLRQLMRPTWSEAYEPTRGGGMGIPDVQFCIAGVLLPVELKVGEVVDARVMSERIRPDQISWHNRLRDVGGKSAFLVGVPAPARKWRAFHVGVEQLSRWKEGFVIGQDCEEIAFKRSDLIHAWSGLLGLREAVDALR